MIHRKIPGDLSAEAQAIRWEDYGATKAGQFYMYRSPAGCYLKAVVSRDPTLAGDLWHLSVSHSDAYNEPDRCPTWDELKHAKFSLMPVDLAMVLIFPRRTDNYVNDHPTTLHLWEAIDQR